MSLAGKRVFITGGSRGIGLEIAKRIAKDGAMIAIAAKTAEANPKLPGTIYTAAEEIEVQRRRCHLAATNPGAYSRCYRYDGWLTLAAMDWPSESATLAPSCR